METAAEEGCCGSRVECVHNPLALWHHCLVTCRVKHEIRMATRCGSYLDFCNPQSFRHSPADLQGKTGVLCEVITVAAVVKHHQDTESVSRLGQLFQDMLNCVLHSKKQSYVMSNRNFVLSWTGRVVRLTRRLILLYFQRRPYSHIHTTPTTAIRKRTTETEE